MGEPLYEEVVGARQAEPAVPDLCAGRHARDAARLSRAPAAGERRQHLVRQPHRRSMRCRSRRWSPIRCGGARRSRRSARRIRRSRCRATLFGAGAGEFRRARSQRTNSGWRRSRAALLAGLERLAARADPGAMARRRRPARTCVNPADRRDIVGQVVEADAGEVDARSLARCEAAPIWHADAAGGARRVPAARRGSAGGADADA